jgi:hypothetical protein
MKNLDRYIQLYIAMDARRRLEALQFAELQVKSFTPAAVAPAPLLRLVKGGGK